MRRRTPVLLAVVVLLGLAGCSPEPAAPEELEVTWGDPGCVYDESSSTVSATLVATGTGTADVTVTAHRDEDTSAPVGSMTRSVVGEGEEQTVELAFTVSGEPYVDIDGVVACSIDVVEAVAE